MTVNELISVGTNGRTVTQRYKSPITELKHVPFPYLLKEVSLESYDMATRREIIKRNNGKVVALRGSAYGPGFLYMAQIRADPQNQDSFYFRPIKATGELMKKEEVMNYVDLEQLMETKCALANDLGTELLREGITTARCD